MARSLYIERKKKSISKAEFDTAVRNGVAFEAKDFLEATNPITKEVIRVRFYGAVWIDHPAGGRPVFTHREGSIKVDRPDDATIGKMKEIATALGGKVVTDEGQEY